MIEPSMLEQMKNWGYYLFPKPHPHCPGCNELWIAMRKQPTGEHFDPETLYLRLRDTDGAARWKKMSLLTPLEDLHHVCPGTVTLNDRFDKRVDFFTFGGSLEMALSPDSGEDVYALKSPAPILELTVPKETVPDQLASETESLIGESEAKWTFEEKEFNQRLAQVDPLQFYIATLQSILLRYEHTLPLQETYRDLYDTLCRDKEWLVEKNQWPPVTTTLENLLAKK